MIVKGAQSNQSLNMHEIPTVGLPIRKLVQLWSVLAAGGYISIPVNGTSASEITLDYFSSELHYKSFVSREVSTSPSVNTRTYTTDTVTGQASPISDITGSLDINTGSTFYFRTLTTVSSTGEPTEDDILSLYVILSVTAVVLFIVVVGVVSVLVIVRYCYPRCCKTQEVTMERQRAKDNDYQITRSDQRSKLSRPPLPVDHVRPISMAEEALYDEIPGNQYENRPWRVPDEQDNSQVRMSRVGESRDTGSIHSVVAESDDLYDDTASTAVSGVTHSSRRLPRTPGFDTASTDSSVIVMDDMSVPKLLYRPHIHSAGDPLNIARKPTIPSRGETPA